MGAVSQQPGTDSPDVDLDLLEYLQSLTPRERVLRHDQALELVQALRRAGVVHYGVDPRSPEIPDGSPR
jgi:hypothetical protein